MKKAFQIEKDRKEDTSGIIQHEKKEAIRLNKYISSSGYCSRREADRLIEAHKVTIDGEIATLATKVEAHQKVMVEQTLIEHKQEMLYIALHKPVGITCTTDTAIDGNMVDFMNHKESIFPIGRLDKESSGLILLTNDGDIVNKILRSVNHHEKEYIVKVDKPIQEDFIQELRKGVKIYNAIANTYQTTKPAIVEQIDTLSFRIVLTEGLNRQIRRMCTAFQYKVVKLERVRIMNIHLEPLNVGQWRYLHADELRTLNSLIQDSKSFDEDIEE